MLGRVVEPLIRLQLDLPEQSVPVRIDPAQVEQILLNLVLNARDAMPSGGQLRIALAHRTLDEAEARAASIAPGEYALLSVEDSGTGMSEETQRHLFEPFFTTKQHGQGTGLGLATVYASVTQLGGTIRVASELGRGTRFTILLPRSPRAAEESEPVVEVRPHARRAGESRRVLLVEDQAEVRQVVREALERDGFDVVAAQDGLAAVAEFDAPGARFDLLLTDVVMPGLRGDELARALRRRNRDLKIVAMTAYARPRDGEPEIVIDGARWIAKPFTPRDIVEAVRAELGEASQRLPASSSR
jgi:CheY-like chemotaxis protein